MHPAKFAALWSERKLGYLHDLHNRTTYSRRTWTQWLFAAAMGELRAATERPPVRRARAAASAYMLQALYATQRTGYERKPIAVYASPPQMGAIRALLAAEEGEAAGSDGYEGWSEQRVLSDSLLPACMAINALMEADALLVGAVATAEPVEPQAVGREDATKQEALDLLERAGEHVASAASKAADAAKAYAEAIRAASDAAAQARMPLVGSLGACTAVATAVLAEGERLSRDGRASVSRLRTEVRDEEYAWARKRRLAELDGAAGAAGAAGASGARAPHASVALPWVRAEREDAERRHALPEQDHAQGQRQSLRGSRAVGAAGDPGETAAGAGAMDEGAREEDDALALLGAGDDDEYAILE